MQESIKRFKENALIEEWIFEKGYEKNKEVAKNGNTGRKTNERI